ncbi:MAG: GerMN domain-containing protein [Bacilli bacterium]|nr:GerMN domain-containing protein [Bacilli bacterium]
MIIKRSIKKILITTFCLFIVVCIYTITNINREDTIKVNLELEDISLLTNTNIYLLNNDGYLVQKKIFIDSTSIEDRIRKIINYLKITETSKYSSNLRGVINKDCIIIELNYDEGFITLNFNKYFNDVDNINIVVASLVHSLYSIGDVKGVSILVEGNYLDDYPKIIDNSIDLNKEVYLTSRNDVSKVVVYYLSKDNDDYYYVPVSKYLNDSKDKINIIVQEMVSSSSNNLISLVNSNLELISSREENDTMILNFNNYLFDNNDEVLEEVLYCISYSVFDNYDVSMIMFEIDGKSYKTVDRKSL